VDGIIYYHFIHLGKGGSRTTTYFHRTTDFDFSVSVVETSCEYSGLDSTGEVLSGSMRLYGSLVSTIIFLDLGSSFPDPPRYSVYCGSVKIGSFCPDSPLSAEEIKKAQCQGYPVHCLKMATLTKFLADVDIFLVLRGTCLENFLFERIGLLNTDYIEDSDKQAFNKHIKDHSVLQNIKLI
jgi:hypothetical protein